MNKKLLCYIAGVGALFYPTLALAYIGPGLGTGAVAAVLGTVAGLLMLLIGVVWYPLKRLMARFRPQA